MVDLVSIVVNYKTDDLLRNFLTSYDRYVALPSRKLCIYDVEVDRTPFWNERPDDEVLWSYSNVGYARAVNTATFFNVDTTTNIAIFNADTEFVDSSCVDSCLDLLDSNDDIAVVGPLQTNDRGKVTHAGIFGTDKNPSHRGWMSNNPNLYRDIDEAITVSGSAYFTKSSIWNEMTDCPLYREAAPTALGGFLPTPLYYEETFYSYHVRNHGYKVMYNGKAEMIHHWHASVNNNSAYADECMRSSQQMFRNACEIHNIEHD